MAKLRSYSKTKNYCLHKCHAVSVDYDPDDLVCNEALYKMFNDSVLGFCAIHEQRRSGTFYFADEMDAFEFKLRFSSLPSTK